MTKCHYFRRVDNLGGFYFILTTGIHFLCRMKFNCPLRRPCWQRQDLLKCRPCWQRREFIKNQFQCVVCNRTKCFCRCKKRYRIVSLIRLLPVTVASFFIGYFVCALGFEIVDSLVEKSTGISFSDSFVKCKEVGNFGFGVSFFSLIQAIVEDKLQLTLLLVAGIIVKDARLIRYVNMIHMVEKIAIM